MKHRQFSCSLWDEATALPLHMIQRVLLGKWQPGQLAKAIEDVREDGREPTPGRIVAAVTFSFWTSMFGREYETLWQTTLHRIGSRPDGKGLRRKDFSGPLAQIRILRNRIAHHEPIISWDLPKRTTTRS